MQLQLFNATEHREKTLSDLRQKSCKILELVEPFNAYVAGAVLDEVLKMRHAEIDIQLYPDSAKDVEIFLLNRHIEFSHSPPRTPRAKPS